MSAEIRRISVAISLLVFLLFGCETIYQKKFGFDITSRHIVNTYFEFRGLICTIRISVWPIDKELFSSSNTYEEPWFGVVVERKKCDSQMTALFESITLRSIGVEYGDTAIQFEQESFEAISPCYSSWDFSDIVIPDSVDTLYMNIGLSYTDSGNVINADTVVTLYRFQDKWKQMWLGNT